MEDVPAGDLRRTRQSRPAAWIARRGSERECERRAYESTGTSPGRAAGRCVTTLRGVLFGTGAVDVRLRAGRDSARGVARRAHRSRPPPRCCPRRSSRRSRRGNQFIAAAVSFISDIVPLPAGDLVAPYRRAREFAADAHAAREAGPCDHAEALLAFARGSPSCRRTIPHRRRAGGGRSSRAPFCSRTHSGPLPRRRPWRTAYTARFPCPHRGPARR